MQNSKLQQQRLLIKIMNREPQKSFGKKKRNRSNKSKSQPSWKRHGLGVTAENLSKHWISDKPREKNLINTLVQNYDLGKHTWQDKRPQDKGKQKIFIHKVMGHRWQHLWLNKLEAHCQTC